MKGPVISVFLISIVILVSCSKNPVSRNKPNSILPKVKIVKIANVGSDVATIKGKVVTDGGSGLEKVGLCLDTTGTPTIKSSIQKVISHPTIGNVFSVTFSKLKSNRTYYVRAYAKNKTGVAYSKQFFFNTTHQIKLPKVIIGNIIHLGNSTATIEGKVLTNGSGNLRGAGLCWDTSKKPTKKSSICKPTYSIVAIGKAFSVTMPYLKKHTTYHVRAYAINEAGIGYSDTTLTITTRINWDRAANKSIAGLISNYWNSQGYFNTDNGSNYTFQYWPQAHAMDILVSAYTRTHNKKYSQRITELYNGIPKKMGGYINGYYDDMEWNTLAFLRAYKATKENKFKQTVVNVLWPEIKGGWTKVGGGGIMWSKHTPRSKNAVSNAPASIIASILYMLDHKKSDLEWAKKIFQWEKNNLFDPNSGAVWDHLKVSNNGDVHIKKSWIFTYNQGTFAGAALKLYQITGKDSYLKDAVKAIDYTLDNQATNGIMNKGPGGDGALFKGIFIRYLKQMILEKDLPNSKRERYVKFLKKNAETLWDQGTNVANTTFGQYWGTPPGGTVILKADLSGVILMESAAVLSDKGLLHSN